MSDVMNGVVGNNYAWYDVYFYWEHARDIVDGMAPYVDFKTAYPPFSFVIDLIPYVFTPGEVAFHYGFAMFTYLVSLLAIIGLFRFCDRHGISHRYVYVTFIVLVLGMNNFFIARNDTITTVFVVLCLLLYSEKRYAPAFVCLALGAMTKIYPIFLLPILLIPFIASRDWKSVFKYGLITAAVCMVIQLPFLINDPSTAFSYLTQHSGRGVEIESMLAIPLMIIGLFDPSLVYVGMDESWDLFGPVAEAVSPYFMPLTFAILLVFMVHFLHGTWKMRPQGDIFPLVVLASAVTLMLFMTFNKVFCAQYVIWVVMLYPMIIYACRNLGVECDKLLYPMLFLILATLFTVLAMNDATDSISVPFIIADTVKSIAALYLTYRLLRIYLDAMRICQLTRVSQGRNIG